MKSMIAARSEGSARKALAFAGSALALILATSFAGATQAADATAAAATPGGGAGGEGQQIEGLVVTAESTQVTSTAPTKASLDETQPESIITHKFIEQVTPETGGWTTVLLIAPSISGISSNGGGVGDYQTVRLRGFPDGQFNLTYDGIAFGDTNDPTHHSADYFPASTIGAAIVDRGPGAAGDLGQENFGGALHFYSPVVSDTLGAVQKLTYGSFDTLASVTTLNTGSLAALGGAKLLLNFDERYSSGELSDTTGHQYNQLAKMEIPLGDKGSLTLFANHEYNFFNFEDSAGPGETWAQVVALGKNFSMTNDPNSEHFEGFNYELKRTDFEYADLKYQLSPALSIENQPYTYWYSNKTHSTNDLTGFLGPDLNGVPGTANTSPLQTKGANKTDIGGYDKLNEYRVEGDIMRLNQDWSFGTLKLGGLVEGSRTFRRNCFIDDSIGGPGADTPDRKFTTAGGFPGLNTPCKLLEESSWLQEQVFADFNWRATDSLTISPGFKYVDFTRNVNATNENVAGAPTKNQPLVAHNNYGKPLYFLTANYKIEPYWAVYGQFATSFLIPSLSSLYASGAAVQNLQPQQTTNYQLGTVYTRGALTADADVYLIEATNLQVSCNVPDPTLATGVGAGFCNAGKGRFDGVEAEAAYALPFGLTFFGNGSINDATQLANAANPSVGITANPQQRLANAPGWTAAAGLIYDQGAWRGSFTYKVVGGYDNYANGVTFHLPSYDTLDASVGYAMKHFELKLQVFNMLDSRTVNSFVPGASSTTLFSPTDSTGLYTFQAGRQIQVTVVGKY